jgi:hypothetical protein
MCPVKRQLLTETVENGGNSVWVRMLAICGTFGEERDAVKVGATSHF